ncbi:hypothetical protein JF780_05795 [Mycobacterium intracellulare]|uniref:hypothetical protein n=1 Tax=Mycobacterium intracellulare TaxID=1767 RepID=UPI001929213F|nr:hypothetical protein [Mycobacterium intracellulare]MCA2275504.1 hypothetical protein [Mycobacterium intracellulare]MCA2324464.1 hypothetical protein [Mycobacterium intracellulare]BCP29607.1 hypothetical protein MINTM026_05770 [Mycobacterium intracellulare]
MAVNYGRPANPEAFIIAKLLSLGLPAVPERNQSTGLPCYVVTSVVNKSNRYLLEATVSVHSFAQGDGETEMGRAQASDAAWDADDLLLSQTPGDVVTMPDGRTAGAWIDPHTPPTFADYRDPFIKRYVARYDALLRFQPT